MTMNRGDIEFISQLRWSCRRGMLELDLMLERFLDKVFLSLKPCEKELFKELLCCSDQDLFAWLLRDVPAPDLKFIPLIKKIQEYARTSSLFKTL